MQKIGFNFCVPLRDGDLSETQRQHMRRVGWTVLLAQYTGYFLVSFVWVFGGWAVVTYGVLIRLYLGPGMGRWHHLNVLFHQIHLF